jgi:hypothetical protein
MESVNSKYRHKNLNSYAPHFLHISCFAVPVTVSKFTFQGPPGLFATLHPACLVIQWCARPSVLIHPVLRSRCICDAVSMFLYLAEISEAFGSH